MHLKVSEVSKSFKKNESVLNSVNLELNSGECLCLIGKNGSGKSTLINMIIDVIETDSGQILVFGEKFSNQEINVKKKVGVLPEFNPVIEEFSVQDYLKYVGLIYGVDEELIKERRAYLIGYFFDEEPDSRKTIGQFSKGMKLKTGICAALIHKPKLLILDEPFDGMDTFSSNSLVDFLNEYTAQGNAILISSHDMLFMEKIASKVAVLKEDKLIASNLKEIEESGKSFEAFVTERMGYNPKEIKEFK
ncbi:MAG: ABC transporter ATP-binding protein [Balneola sp.]